MADDSDELDQRLEALIARTAKIGLNVDADLVEVLRICRETGDDSRILSQSMRYMRDMKGTRREGIKEFAAKHEARATVIDQKLNAAKLEVAENLEIQQEIKALFTMLAETDRPRVEKIIGNPVTVNSDMRLQSEFSDEQKAHTVQAVFEQMGISSALRKVNRHWVLTVNPFKTNFLEKLYRAESLLRLVETQPGWAEEIRSRKPPEERSL